MARFDRYMLSQLLLFFGFFALIVVAVFWISRAVRLFERLIADGQSGLVFLEFSALSLPGLILLILPLASFAAAVYVTNRLSTESELTVMIATGTSPWRMARPVVAFGVLIAVGMSILSHFLVPSALDRLDTREREIRRDVTARLLTEGTFLHPTDGVTLYTREITDEGVLKDVFLSDRRVPSSRVIYTASDAYLVQKGNITSLIMVDGLAQRLTPEDGRLSTATFRDFSYDISNLTGFDDQKWRDADKITTPVLVAGWSEISKLTNQDIGVVTEEFWRRFVQPAFGMVTAFVGFAVLLSRGYSRFGAWREILVSFAALLILDASRAGIGDMVRDTHTMWPLMFAPVLAGLLIFLLLIQNATRPLTLRRRRSA